MCVSVCVCVFVCAVALKSQLCCRVFDSIGGAESYSVSVSCVGSPASVHGFDSVPAPQSQKNLREDGTVFQSRTAAKLSVTQFL